MIKTKPNYELANAVRTKLLLFIDKEIQTQKQFRNLKKAKFMQEHVNADTFQITFEEEFFSPNSNKSKKIIDFASQKYINKNKTPETYDETPGTSKNVIVSELHVLQKIHSCKMIQEEIPEMSYKRKFTDDLIEKEVKTKSEKKGNEYLKELYSNLKSEKNLITQSRKKNKKSLFFSKMNNINVKNNLKKQNDKNILSPKLKFSSKKSNRDNNKKTSNVIKLVWCK